MKLIGIGTDLTTVSRFDRIIRLYEKAFIRKVLHPLEIDEFYTVIDRNRSQFLASDSLKSTLECERKSCQGSRGHRANLYVS